MIFNKYKYWKNKYNEVYHEYNSLYRVNNMLRERIELDVIPIYIDEIYPTREQIFHVRDDNDAPRDIRLNCIYDELKQRFFDSNVIIVIENGMVINVLKGSDKE